ncbi:MAG: hypothetical protein ACYSRQ_06860 [Planctomycetota bacterium]
MESNSERRIERRLRYHWPVWFAEDFHEVLHQGQMVDVCSSGAAFSYAADESCPFQGQEITTRFSIPSFGPDNTFSMASFTRKGLVCRVDDMNSFVRRVALEFVEPLPFKPGEQVRNVAEQKDRLKAVTI